MKNFIQNTVIRKLIYLIVGFLFYAVVGMFNDANAGTTRTLKLWGSLNQQTYDSPLEACQANVAYNNLTYGTSLTFTSVGTIGTSFNQSTLCNYHDGQYDQTGLPSYPEYVCPANTTKITPRNGDGYDCQDTCVLPEVYNPAIQACEIPNPCEDLKDKQTRYSTTGNTNFLQCFNGCEVERESGNCSDNAAGSTYCSFSGSYNGNSCTPAPEAPTPPPEEPTPEEDCIGQGKSYATFSGTTVCVPNGTPDTPPVDKYKDKEKTTENPDGSRTETKEQVIESDGNIKTEKTEKTFDSDGNETGSETTTEEQDKPSFCEENPNSEICKEAEESTFGGSCSSSFTCDGDAVQCAIAKKQHQSRCDDIATDSISDLGDTILQGGDSTEGQEGSFSNPKEVEIGDLDSSGFLSKACLPDIQTSTYGTIPISSLCEGLEAAGAIVLAFAYLLSLGIIFKGF